VVSHGAAGTVSEIIISCTKTPPDKDITVAEIRDQHKCKGWPGIGFHFVILRNGTIAQGRDLHDIGKAVCVCLVGGCSSSGEPEDNFTSRQWTSLRLLVLGLKATYPNAEVRGKAPFDVSEWFAGLSANHP
jgi:N-acetylmuramoyl-L-alanine amidase